MALLLHHPASPQSRKVRILMGEKKMLFVLREEEPWRPSDDVYKLNPAGELPIFINDGVTICGGYAITEYLEEINQEAKLIFGTPYEKAEIRRLSEWFDCKFYRDVFKNVADEKIYKRFARGLSPDSKILKAGINNLNFHLEYMDWLLDKRAYLACDEFSLADISAAAGLSILDYLGDVPWDYAKNVKLWYSKVKSRPSFKEILKESIKGILPAKHYTNLDF